MSLIDTIRSMFSSGGGGNRSARRLYLVDGARILDEKAGGKLGPREQIQVLQQLSRFAAQEKVKITAVFEGRPLREVDNGGEFNGVTVFFVEQAAGVQEQIVKLLRKQGASAVVVVTANAALEKSVASQGGITLRASTFRKAFGSNGGGGSSDRSRQQNRRRHGGRSRPQQTSRQPVERSIEAASSDEGAASKQTQPNGGGEKDAVRSLIDLVE